MALVKGFTLIELIIVIILISILSALGIGLLTGTSGFSARVASDLWLTGFRLSQRMALMKQSSSALLTMSIAESTGDWDVTIDFNSVELNSFNIERNQVVFRSSTSDFASSCNTLPAVSFPLTFYFDGYGDLVTSSRNQLVTNTRLCFVGGETVELCISPSGYAYAGVCEL